MAEKKAKSTPIEYFWINDTNLRVDGKDMTPSQAYKVYPEYSYEIQRFVVFPYTNTARTISHSNNTVCSYLFGKKSHSISEPMRSAMLDIVYEIPKAHSISFSKVKDGIRISDTTPLAKILTYNLGFDGNISKQPNSIVTPDRTESKPSELECFWINDSKLRVNGKDMFPEEAQELYPKHANEIKSFVSEKEADFTRTFEKLGIKPFSKPIEKSASPSPEYFWINDTTLRVNGKDMTPEEAYKMNPDHAHEIQKFVVSKDTDAAKAMSGHTRSMSSLSELKTPVMEPRMAPPQDMGPQLSI